MARKMGFDAARHLLSRAGFGGSHAEIEAAAKRSTKDVVEDLIAQAKRGKMHEAAPSFVGEAPALLEMRSRRRELMAINLQAQRPIEIALHATRHPERMQLMARARFGTIIPVRKSASPEAALERARTGKAIAMIEIGDGDWWTALAGDPELTIIDGLLGEGGRGSALAVGRLSRDRLCKDRSYAVLEQSELAARLGRGEAVCPIAVSGDLHLCAIERVVPLARRAA